jgi:hypothetical protein
MAGAGGIGNMRREKQCWKGWSMKREGCGKTGGRGSKGVDGGVVGMRTKRQHMQAKQRPHGNVSIYFHRTTEASAAEILRNGFRDAKGKFLTEREHKGVWLSDVPVDCQDGAQGDSLLVVEIDPVYVEKYEWVEDGSWHRDYLVPAKLLTRHASLRRATEEDERLGDEKADKRKQNKLRSMGLPVPQKRARAQKPRRSTRLAE